MSHRSRPLEVGRLSSSSTLGGAPMTCPHGAFLFNNKEEKSPFSGSPRRPCTSLRGALLPCRARPGDDASRLSEQKNARAVTAKFPGLTRVGARPGAAPARDRRARFAEILVNPGRLGDRWATTVAAVSLTRAPLAASRAGWALDRGGAIASRRSSHRRRSGRRAYRHSRARSVWRCRGRDRGFRLPTSRLFLDGRARR